MTLSNASIQLKLNWGVTFQHEQGEMTLVWWHKDVNLYSRSNNLNNKKYPNFIPYVHY